jgi:hypothetical protein
MQQEAAGTAAPPGMTPPGTSAMPPAGTAGTVATMSSAGSSAPTPGAGDEAHGSQNDGCGCGVLRSRPAPPVFALLAVAWIALRRRAARRCR